MGLFSNLIILLELPFVMLGSRYAQIGVTAKIDEHLRNMLLWWSNWNFNSSERTVFNIWLTNSYWCLNQININIWIRSWIININFLIAFLKKHHSKNIYQKYIRRNRYWTFLFREEVCSKWISIAFWSCQVSI